MAVAYKSEGAGVGTETNGAALQPACPATVDAGDILIGHVIHTGTSTAPSTPSGGWEPLYGPADVGTTATARHWCFGKIADGSEDGATVDFGTAGGTNGRAARIYSFSGRVSGTITELCPSATFSDIPHATDPQGPTVDTLIAGGLAVALTCQDDNNTEEAIAGASGGTWGGFQTYVNATWGPQGIHIDIQVATPTGDPGTISGGAIVAANDESGTIGFAILPEPLPDLGPVREFNGTSDTLDRATGALSAMTFGTVASIFRTDDVTVDYQDQFSFHNSGGSFLWAALNIHVGGNAIAWFTNTDGLGPDISTGTWYLVVSRKATGTSPVRFSVYNYTSTTWTHANSINTSGSPVSLANGTSPGASGTIRFEFEDTSSYFDGRVAVQAAWANAVHWTADSSGDTAIEAAGLEDALQNWADESPDALWAFNQTSTGTAVDDLTGGGADQAAINGTSVVTIDGPDPFDWSLTAGVTGTGAGSYSFTATAAGVPETFGTAAGTFTFGSAATGVDRALGAAAGSYSFTATASGQTGAPPVEGQAVGAYTFTGSASGTPETFGTATTALGFTGTAAGVPRTPGAATGGYTFTSTATGIDRAIGVAATNIGFGSTATGIPEVFGTSVAALTFTGTANGFAGTPPVTGQATGTYTFSSSAAGVDRALGAAAASLTFSSSAAGITDVHGTAVAPFTVTTTAIGQRKTFAQAAATLAFSAVGSGFVGELPVPAGVPLYVTGATYTLTAGSSRLTAGGRPHDLTVPAGDHVVEA